MFSLRITRRRFQFSLRTILVVVTLCAVGLFVKLQYDWYRKLALIRGWIATCVAETGPDTYWSATRIEMPAGTSEAGELKLLDLGFDRFKSREEQTALLKMLLERHPTSARDRLGRMLDVSSEPEVRSLQLHLLGLYRDKTIVDRFVPFLDDDSAIVRAAAVESIGFIRCPSYALPMPRGFFQFARTVSVPPIDVDEIGFAKYLDGGQSQITSLPDDREPEVIEVPVNLRSKFEAMMLTGATAHERSAAARALLTWPPYDYRLRVAEWGVWLSDEGELKLMQAVLDEIPDFVHRTGNRLASLEDRVNKVMFITKPIVHLTVNGAMAVDLEVLISHGRPWFAYPKPDDFTLTAGVTRDPVGDQPQPQQPLERYDRAELGELSTPSEGYPWLSPHHRMNGPTSSVLGLTTPAITSVGLRWQSLIVSPQRQAWMALPEVTEPNHAWWKRLRDVPSSWVSSQGETERFLYYDGPTLLDSPLDALLSGDELTLSEGADIPDYDLRQFAMRRGDPRVISDATRARRAFFIEVSGGTLRARRLGVLRGARVVTLSELPLLEGEAAIAGFRLLLAETGLSDAEIGGLQASWNDHFFKTDGQRLLLILSKDDYNAMCPLVVRPEPTEIVRVGIVLFEF